LPAAPTTRRDNATPLPRPGRPPHRSHPRHRRHQRLHLREISDPTPAQRRAFDLIGAPIPLTTRSRQSPSPPDSKPSTTPVSLTQGTRRVRDWRGGLGSVSSPSPSNRACDSPAHGSPTFFTVGVSRPDRQPATGLPGDYPDRTFTGWRRRASDQVMTARQSPPDALGARNFGLSRHTRHPPAPLLPHPRRDHHPRRRNHRPAQPPNLLTRPAPGRPATRHQGPWWGNRTLRYELA
jgi:hypothetical protein